MFKDIDTWSEKKLKKWNIWLNIIYCAIVYVGIIICFCINYSIFGHFEKHWTGLAIIVLACVAIFLLKRIRKMVSKFPEAQYNERLKKFIIELIFNMAIPAVIIIMLVLLKKILIKLY